MKIYWERIQTEITDQSDPGMALYKAPEIFRSKIPGGWLIFLSLSNINGVTFLPDPEHEWDGNSLPSKHSK
jgi:hypothetical protein